MDFSGRAHLANELREPENVKVQQGLITAAPGVYALEGGSTASSHSVVQRGDRGVVSRCTTTAFWIDSNLVI